MQKIDKDNLKNMLSIEDVFNYVTELGGEPKMMNGFLSLILFAITRLELVAINYIIMIIHIFFVVIQIAMILGIYMN